MFDQFWCKIRFCENRCPWHSFWTRTNFWHEVSQNWLGYKMLSQIFKIFKNENTWQKCFWKKCFWKYFQKFWVFFLNTENVSNTFSRWVSVAIFSLISQQMAELSAFSFFSIPVTLYYQNSNACFGMFWKSHKKKQMVSLDSWAQTTSDRDLFYCFWSHLKFYRFWPDLNLTFS